MKINETVKVFQKLKDIDTSVKSVVIFTDTLNISHGILCEKSVGQCLKSEISINEIVSLNKCFCFEEVSFSKHETNNTVLTLDHVAFVFEHFENELKKYSNLNLEKITKYRKSNFYRVRAPEFFRVNSALITSETEKTFSKHQETLKENLLQLSRDVENYLSQDNLMPEIISLFVKNHVDAVFDREFNIKSDDENFLNYRTQLQEQLTSDSIKDSTRYLLFNQESVIDYWSLNELKTGSLLEVAFFNTNKNIISLPKIIFQALKGKVFSEKSAIEVPSDLPESVLETMLVLHADDETLHIKEVYDIAVNI